MVGVGPCMIVVGCGLVVAGRCFFAFFCCFLFVLSVGDCGGQCLCLSDTMQRVCES